MSIKQIKQQQQKIKKRQKIICQKSNSPKEVPFRFLMNEFVGMVFI